MHCAKVQRGETAGATGNRHAWPAKSSFALPKGHFLDLRQEEKLHTVEQVGRWCGGGGQGAGQRHNRLEGAIMVQDIDPVEAVDVVYDLLGPG